MTGINSTQTGERDAEASPPPGRKRILVVDDELAFGEMIKMTLELTGRYKVWAVSSATQAPGVAKSFQPDLILLDCMMPGMDGGELAGLLESDPALKRTPVAFLTATVSAPETAASRCYKGVRTYLPKMLPLNDLIDFIERQTAGTEPTAGPAAGG
jgi:CheY-like chemotaxis protein